MARAAPGRLTRRGLTGLLLSAAASAAGAAAPANVRLRGRLIQGGALIGRTLADEQILLDGVAVSAASKGGWFILGFDRDAAPQAELVVGDPAAPWRRTLSIAQGVFAEQRIDGLPNDQVAPSDPSLLERIKREVAAKAAAFASRNLGDGFREGFIWPVEGFRTSGVFGSRRVLNGVPKTPHYGVDLAAAEGTPIRAPADGLVVLAEPQMHFEGGLTLIDHGQGLVAAYLHQSAQTVRAGDRVRRGQRIGAVGKTGRATGAHLCWRLKWRGRNLDPSLLVGSLPEIA